MQRINFLYEATQAVLSTYDLDEVLNRILAIARDHFRLENGAILLFDGQSGELYLRSYFGSDRRISKGKLPITRGLTGAAFRTKQCVYVPDVTQDSRYVKGLEETRSELAVPLVVNGTAVGVMDFQSDQLDSFDQETIDLLKLFATQASVALQNAQLYSMVQKRAAQLEAINSIAKQATLEVGLSELLTRFCSQLPKSFPVDHVAVLLRETDSEGQLTLRGQFGTLRPHLSSTALTSLQEQLEIAPKREPQRLIAIGQQRWFEHAHSEVALPLVSFGRHLGILLCASKQAGGFTENDLRALESVADILATSVQNAMYVEAVRQLAYRDGLTGIFNRRHFEVKILDELARASRYSGAVSILMIDIDHFKAINDEFGHLLGDEVLKQVAAIFGKVLRKVDVSCRYGGEEFAVILPATRLNSARAVADKLRQSIETYEFPGIPRPITISIGVAEAPSHGMVRDELVSAADAALYQSKQGGRNRVSCGVLHQSQNPQN